MALMMFWIALIIILSGNIGMVVAEYDPPPLGVVYGMAGSDLPDPKSVVELCHKYGFKKIRLLDYNYDMMQALINQNIVVSIGIKNDLLPWVVWNEKNLQLWYRTTVKPYIGKIPIEYIVVGNEAIPGSFSEYVATAILAIKVILSKNGLGMIKVTTAVSTSVLGATFPPSNGVLKNETSYDMMTTIDTIVKWNSKPVLMVNVYPYHYHAAGLISQDFATFTTQKVVYLGDNNIGYWNMLDALLDAFNSALTKVMNVSRPSVNLVVGASGWPSNGNGEFTTPGLASTYNQNLMRRLARKQGTPARPADLVTGFVYALFNENGNPTGPDQHFGLFNTNETPAYVFSVPPST